MRQAWLTDLIENCLKRDPNRVTLTSFSVDRYGLVANQTLEASEQLGSKLLTTSHYLSNPKATAELDDVGQIVNFCLTALNSKDDRLYVTPQTPYISINSDCSPNLDLPIPFKAQLELVDLAKALGQGLICPDPNLWYGFGSFAGLDGYSFLIWMHKARKDIPKELRTLPSLTVKPEADHLALGLLYENVSIGEPISLKAYEFGKILSVWKVISKRRPDLYLPINVPIPFDREEFSFNKVANTLKIHPTKLAQLLVEPDASKHVLDL